MKSTEELREIAIQALRKEPHMPLSRLKRLLENENGEPLTDDRFRHGIWRHARNRLGLAKRDRHMKPYEPPPPGMRRPNGMGTGKKEKLRAWLADLIDRAPHLGPVDLRDRLADYSCVWYGDIEAFVRYMVDPIRAELGLEPARGELDPPGVVMTEVESDGERKRCEVTIRVEVDMEDLLVFLAKGVRKV